MNSVRYLIVFCTIFYSSFLFSENLSEDSPYLAKDSNETESSSISFEMKRDSDSAQLPSTGKVLVVLSVVTIMAFAAVFLLKRFGYGEKKVFVDTSIIKILASKKLSVKSTVHYIDVDGVTYVITEKDNAIALSRHSLRGEKDNLS